ncbi:MAG: HDIG domain-containing protein [Candidatus Odinarchaeota archaeon]
MPVISLPDKKKIYALFTELNLETGVVKHSEAVCAAALEIAEAIALKRFPVNIKLVEAGALLHDIGRSRVNDLSHGVIGGQIILSKGYSIKLKRIAETHVLGGLTEQEARVLGLPSADYIPRTLEEKICCYADKISFEDKRVTVDRRFQLWISKYGETPLIKEAYKRIKLIEEELINLQKKG